MFGKSLKTVTALQQLHQLVGNKIEGLSEPLKVNRCVIGSHKVRSTRDCTSKGTGSAASAVKDPRLILTLSLQDRQGSWINQWFAESLQQRISAQEW